MRRALAIVVLCAAAAPGILGRVMSTWSLPHLAEELRVILETHERLLAEAQEPHGLDALSEIAIHSVLGAGLAANFAVAREVHYPSSMGKASERRRCDLVLTACAKSPPYAARDPLWLELKLAHQLSPGDRRNPRYGAQWRSAITRDLGKLSCDPQIAQAALGFVVFTDGEATLARDLLLFERLLSTRELLAGTPSEQSFAITDRIGHRTASVILWPLLHAR